MSKRTVIAVDLGADSGRVIQVSFDGNSLDMQDVNRFPNVPVMAGGTLHWDVLRLWHDIQTGVNAAATGASSVGIDTWGVDFALLDRHGNLMSNPVHYRDPQKDGMYDWVFERVPRRDIFDRTGIQFLVINGLYELARLKRIDSPLLENAAKFVTIADLFNYWFSGHLGCEFTHATTLQMFNPRTQDWDRETLGALGIPLDIFPEIVQAGTTLGKYNGLPVIAPACHDTGSAVVAVPTTTSDYAYISSGTWSLIGLEIPEPIINDAVYEANLTNEGGAYGTYRLLKNVAGMWLAQQSLATWRAEGKDYTYDTLTQMAQAAEPFLSFIDVDDPLFLAPGDIPERIREFCRRSGQVVPETPGQVMRVAYESLALKYRLILDKLIALSGREVRRIHIVGGGTKNALMNQFTADACNREVVTGPVEATALGNAIVQLIALGEFRDIADARAMLSRTIGTSHYEPKHVDAWAEAYGRFQQYVTTT